jgi:hypothetical protein
VTRVLYVGNLSDDDTSPPHSTENHVKQALRNLGHECLPVQERGLDWSTLPGLVSQNQPDLMLWTRTGGFDPADLGEQERAIKSLNVPTAGIHLDRWVGLAREPDVFRSPFFRVDYLFTADGGHDDFWRQHGINHYWSPPAILSDEAKRVGVFRQEYAADVGFVGNLRKYGHLEWQPYRHSLYRFLSLTYRGRFKLWEGGIRGQDLADLYASVKVLIGDSCLAGNPSNYWSDRVPETLGRGGFLIHPRVEGLMEGVLNKGPGQFIEGKHLFGYDLGDFDNLQSNINYYLLDDKQDERRAIAEAGRQHVLATATYEHRLERVLSTVLS